MWHLTLLSFILRPSSMAQQMLAPCTCMVYLQTQETNKLLSFINNLFSFFKYCNRKENKRCIQKQPNSKLFLWVNFLNLFIRGNSQEKTASWGQHFEKQKVETWWEKYHSPTREEKSTHRNKLPSGFSSAFFTFTVCQFISAWAQLANLTQNWRKILKFPKARILEGLRAPHSLIQTFELYSLGNVLVWV